MILLKPAQYFISKLAHAPLSPAGNSSFTELQALALMRPRPELVPALSSAERRGLAARKD